MPAPSRSDLTAGTVVLHVTPAPSFVLDRHDAGEHTWAYYYAYLIERVDNSYGHPTYFVKTLTDRPGGKPATWVYTGTINPHTGAVRLTTRSAFPAHATRVRVLDRVCRAIFAGRTDAITSAGWQVDATVQQELAGRF